MKHGFKTGMAALVVLVAWGTIAGASEHFSNTCDPHARAGHPTRVAWYAKPSNNSHYIPYRVGGGAMVKGNAPLPDEGTWGWDYQGLLPRRIQLGWWHGRHRQGGSGAYKTDGPGCPTCPAR
jgi:hypothetical protein